MLREIRTFLAVAKRGTFAAAGQQVGLTQSAVSAQIKHLEQALGITLFDRSARAASLNAAGQRALPIAEQLLELFQAMGQPDSLDSYRGELRIGAIGSVQTGLLPAALVRLREQAPQIDAKLVPGVSINLLSQLDAGELDVAILIRPPFDLPSDLHCEVIAREPFVLITPPALAGECPLALLEQQPFVRYDRASFGGRLVSQFLREQRIEPRQVLELDELDAIVKMVQSGLGVSLIPLAGLWLERREGVRVLELGARVFYRELVLIERSAQRQRPLQQLFRRCLPGQGAAAR
ncbi:LysR substrate-binding domain-containing protein [Pseudomonas sp. NPDC007930]|uniref:LysR family transcriptional regulator n=1 Tax=Pseudomonas sp. NPDC007930 TaxID=3364417 RepID=UPI0036E5A950